MKSYKGNDIWAMAVVNFGFPRSSAMSSEFESLVTEFEDVFAKPTTLPPLEFMIMLFL
jgi:hypothetical protein